MRRTATLIAAAVALAGVAEPAPAAEPRAAEQDWLPRVVPSGSTPPAGPIPAIAVIAGGVDVTHPDLAGGAITQRRLRTRADPSAAEEGVARGTAIASIVGAPRDEADAAQAIRRAAGDGARVVLAGAPFTGAARCDEHGDAVAEATGAGALDLAAALGHAAPPADSAEPDDDVRWIDGTGATRARPALLRRARTASVAGRLDSATDPRDVHPMRLPGGGQVTIRLSARGRLPVDFYAWQPTAETVLAGERAGLISGGQRPRLSTETLRILNDDPTAATMWVEVRAAATDRRRSGGSQLTATR